VFRALVIGVDVDVYGAGFRCPWWASPP